MEEEKVGGVVGATNCVYLSAWWRLCRGSVVVPVASRTLLAEKAYVIW